MAVDGGYMIPYTLRVPGSAVDIEMIPVRGGSFRMGSSEDSAEHEEDEGPVVEVKVGPMWVAKYETTWGQYRLYMSMYKLFKDLESQGLRKLTDNNSVDAVTAPTELYDPTFTFEFGQDDNLPAVTMTQFAAKQYTKWLSKLTGHQYRLPSEAEWEYACRAGTSTAYGFGDDPSQLEEYAWYYDNADELPHLVGQKQPNAFGLYDMHGNVMEMAIDGYTEDGYGSLAEKTQPMSILQSIHWAEEADNRVVRGGSFQDDPEALRSAARIGSADREWKEQDPNVPLSPWWFTDDPSRGVGFRIFRSYDSVDEDTIKKFWDVDNEDIAFDIEMRLSEGRGTQLPVDQTLSEDIKNIK
ncbi:MAG: SUMF1/EgtB/PvdO family nonheme iron enzyme [Planctomycetales bacterium]|nr:SUMF1/EgtB/PvdO family nonheme iron enzyme [Planctomycetales bacterium]